MMRATPLKREVDPRIERSRQVIFRGALDELGEIGYGGFTIELVAARAGVGKSTIYRHWSDKLSLIADAFQTFHEMGPDIERTLVRHGSAFPPHRHTGLFQPRRQRIEGCSVAIITMQPLPRYGKARFIDLNGPLRMCMRIPQTRDIDRVKITDNAPA